MNKYYKAYEQRYKQSYNLGSLWETKEITLELAKVMEKYNISKGMSILEVGCGEGRDAIHLLDNGYNLVALDYSKSAINKINELTNNKYKDNFIQLDIIEDSLDKKYDFIYSIAVLHMFVLEEDRNKYWNFIKKHLNKNGLACIMCMGDGIKEYKSNINDAFKLYKKTNINTKKEILVANTSCKIVNWETLKKEISRNNLEIIDYYISKDIPNFDKVMCVIIKND